MPVLLAELPFHRGGQVAIEEPQPPAAGNHCWKYYPSGPVLAAEMKEKT